MEQLEQGKLNLSKYQIDTPGLTHVPLAVCDSCLDNSKDSKIPLIPDLQQSIDGYLKNNPLLQNPKINENKDNETVNGTLNKDQSNTSLDHANKNNLNQEKENLKKEILLSQKSNKSLQKTEEEVVNNDVKDEYPNMNTVSNENLNITESEYEEYSIQIFVDEKKNDSKNGDAMFYLMFNGHYVELKNSLKLNDSGVACLFNFEFVCDTNVFSIYVPATKSYLGSGLKRSSQSTHFRLKVQDFTDDFVECFILNEFEDQLVVEDKGLFSLISDFTFNPKHMFKIVHRPTDVKTSKNHDEYQTEDLQMDQISLDSHRGKHHSNSNSKQLQIESGNKKYNNQNKNSKVPEYNELLDDDSQQNRSEYQYDVDENMRLAEVNQRNQDQFLAVRKTPKKGQYFHANNRMKTDIELKQEMYKKIDIDAVIKTWEFKAKGKYQSKLLEAYIENKKKLLAAFVNEISDEFEPKINVERLPYYFSKVADICDFYLDYIEILQVLEDNLNKIRYKGMISYKEAFSFLFSYFATLEKYRFDYYLFGKISIEDKIAPNKGLDNPLEILKIEGLSIEQATEIDKKKDLIRRKLDNKIGKSLKELFWHYTKLKGGNVQLESLDKMYSMQERDFLKFAKEFDIWIIIKTNNIRDQHKNKELLLKVYKKNATFSGKYSSISFEVFKRILNEMAELIFKYSNKNPILEMYRFLGVLDGTFKDKTGEHVIPIKTNTTKYTRVEELESNNRLNIQYLKGKQKLIDLTEEQVVHKFTTNQELKPSRPHALGYDFNKAVNGKSNITREEILSQKLYHKNTVQNSYSNYPDYDQDDQDNGSESASKMLALTQQAYHDDKSSQGLGLGTGQQPSLHRNKSKSSKSNTPYDLQQGKNPYDSSDDFVSPDFDPYTEENEYLKGLNYNQQFEEEVYVGQGVNDTAKKSNKSKTNLDEAKERQKRLLESIDNNYANKYKKGMNVVNK